MTLIEGSCISKLTMFNSGGVTMFAMKSGKLGKSGIQILVILVVLVSSVV